MNCFIFLQAAGQSTIESMQPEQMATEETQSFLDLAIKGGWVMIPILILSIVAVYIFFERYFAITKAGKTNIDFMNRIKDYIHEDRIEAAQSLCQATESPVARMVEKGIQRIGRPLNDINAAIENVGKLEIYKLERGLPTLATVGGAAPMIGFFGTVIGMIQAFYEMSMAGANIDVSNLSGGIYTAMVTTASGLIVGIIAYFAYNVLVARVEKVVFNLEATSTEFMDILNEPV